MDTRAQRIIPTISAGLYQTIKGKVEGEVVKKMSVPFWVWFCVRGRDTASTTARDSKVSALHQR